MCSSEIILYKLYDLKLVYLSVKGKDFKNRSIIQDKYQ